PGAALPPSLRAGPQPRRVRLEPPPADRTQQGIPSQGRVAPGTGGCRSGEDQATASARALVLWCPVCSLCCGLVSTTVTQAAIDAAGLEGVELVDTFPVLTGNFGYIRGDPTPGESRLVPFKDARGNYAIYA